MVKLDIDLTLFIRMVGQTRQQETSAGKTPEEPPKQSKNRMLEHYI